MSTVNALNSDGVAAADAWAAEPARRWNEARARFLAAVQPEQREAVESVLQHLHYGGSGIRNWLDLITWRSSPLPESLPADLIDVYLNDSEAAPLHDCEQCGAAIPVRPNRHAAESEPAMVYFKTCPICSGRTGPYAFWTKRADSRSSEFVQGLRHRRPR